MPTLIDFSSATLPVTLSQEQNGVAGQLNTWPPQSFPAQTERTTWRLQRREALRRMWHMTPGLLPFALAPLKYPRPLPWDILISVTVLTAILTAAGMYFYRTIAREGETHCMLNAMCFSIITIPLLFLFPSHPELAAVALTVMTFGDGSATLFGLLFGQRTLPWNASKTWVGFFSFFAVATLPTIFAYWLVADPAVSFEVATIIGLISVLMGQAMESISGHGGDNYRVGIAAAFGVILSHTLLLGWPG